MATAAGRTGMNPLGCTVNGTAMATAAGRTGMEPLGCTMKGDRNGW